MQDIQREKGQSLELSNSITSIMRHTLNLSARVLELAALEVRLAGFSLALIIGAGIGIVLLLVTTWLLLMSSIALAMITAGYSWGASLLILACINLLAMVPLLYAIKALSRNLFFKFTRKQVNAFADRGDKPHA